MNIIPTLFAREYALNRDQKQFNTNLTASRLSLVDEYVFNDLNECGAPPLTCCLRDGLMAIANDSGDVDVIKDNNNGNKLSSMKRWRAHNNAVFDIKWRPQYNQLATGCGDKSIAIWDIDSPSSIECIEMSHNGSIKSIDFDDSNIFASGSRDGLIKVWDMRCLNGGAVIIIEKGHLSRLPGIKHSPKSRVQRSTPLSSVTCVLFHPLSHQLFSSGANDATIKIWDLRKCRRNKSGSNSGTPIRQINYQTTKGYAPHGFTSLVFNESYALFASCSDHSIYGYRGNTDVPFVKCVGHKVNNFTHIKTLCNNFVVSGSVNGKAYIWPIDMKDSRSKIVWPLCSLPHGEDEVTAIECNNTWINVYTCCDDQRISKWSLHHYNDKSNSPNAELFIRKDSNVEIVTQFNSSSYKPKTPSNTPFSTITNWLEVSGKKIEKSSSGSSSSSDKCSHDSGSIQHKKRPLKENTLDKKSSKRKLFVNNRKISDYFSRPDFNVL